MKIILEFSSFEELRYGISHILQGAVGPETIPSPPEHEMPEAPPTDEKPVVEKSPKRKKSAPVQVEAPKETPKEAPKEESPTQEPEVAEVLPPEGADFATAIDAVKAIVNTYGNQAGIPKAKKLMEDFGAMRASEIAPDELPDFLVAAKKLIAKVLPPKGSKV